MKRFLVLMATIPCLAFGLETVNLLKDASFEKNSELWQTSAGSQWATEDKKDSAVASRHDSLSATNGFFSASGDTRKKPEWILSPGWDSASIIYAGLYSKKISDLDSLTWSQKVFFISNPDIDPNLRDMCFVSGFFMNASQSGWFEFGYLYRPAGSGDINFPRWSFMYFDSPKDTLWKACSRSLKVDMIDVRKYPPQTTVDSFILMGWGYWYTESQWYGQKTYWDNIRLMGYADYDVGVKGFLSKDSVWKDTGYTPTARIKNFGRKPADSFLVIATIEGGAGVVYADTLSWSLTADTEDTVSFKEFKPSDAANYTLTVSTVMTPDESDEDDIISKTLYGTGIEEQPIPAGLVFNITSFTSVPQVSYALPLGEQGTISLYDPSGRRIESHTVIGSGRVTMNSALSSGVYFIKLETSQTTITRKTVVLR